MTTKKIKPCPCCGKKAKIEHEYVEGYDHVLIACECGMRTRRKYHSLPINKSAGTGCDGEAYVIRIWNRRVLP